MRLLRTELWVAAKTPHTNAGMPAVILTTREEAEREAAGRNADERTNAYTARRFDEVWMEAVNLAEREAIERGTTAQQDVDAIWPQST